MNPVSTGCGDNVEDGKGNEDGSTTNPTGGWFWISDPATNKKKMRTSQSTSSLQLFTIKSTKCGSRPDNGATVDNRSDDVGDDHQEELVNEDGSLVERNVVIRRSVSLIHIPSVDNEMMREEVTPSEEKDLKGEGLSKLKGFGDVGVDKDIEDHSASSLASNDEECLPETGDIRKRIEVGLGDEHGGARKQDEHSEEFLKLHQLEEKLTKSQATMRMLHKTNIRYQDEITKLTSTLEDESYTRRVLHEELEASRKLCCELYENLLQERTKRRSTEISEVERQLSPEALKFSLSDAAVQTDVEHVDFCNRKSHQSPLYSSRNRENVSTNTISLPRTEDSVFCSQDAEIPRYDFYLSHLLEEYQENQKNLEVQLKSLSAQCREKDEDLKSVKEKMGGHIRLSSMLQSERVCLEETVEQLREEIKSCDHLIQSCDAVLREKDREIRELQVSKYELERRVAEFEFKEKELQGMVSGFQDDIGDLASQRKKLHKCVKKASKYQSPRKQTKVHEPTKRIDQKEIELQAKAELLNAIREIAFRHSPSPTKDIPHLEVDKADSRQPFNHEVKKHPTRDEAKKSYKACSVKESILVTRENSVIVKKTRSLSVSQESVSMKDALDSEMKDEGSQWEQPAGETRDEVQSLRSCQQERIICHGQTRHGDLPTGNVREFSRKKSEKKEFHRGSHLVGMTSEKVKTERVKKESTRRLNGREITASGIIGRPCRHGNATVSDSLDNCEEKDEVTLSCQNLYSDVMNELSCKNAAAKATATTTTQDAAVEESDAAVEESDGKDSISMEDLSSEDSDGQLHVEPVDSMSSVDSHLYELLDDDFGKYVPKSKAHVQRAANKTTSAKKLTACFEDEEEDDDDDYDGEDIFVANKTTGASKLIASLEDDDDSFSDDDFDFKDLKFYAKQGHLSSNNSNESNYKKRSNLQTVEPDDECPDSTATMKGIKQDQADDITDLARGSGITDDLLSWESPQRLEEIKKGKESRSHGISQYQCGDDLQDDDLEFCVTDEEHDDLELGKKWHDLEDDSSESSSDFHGDPTVPMGERYQDKFSMRQKKETDHTGGQQERNKTFQSGQNPRRYSPNLIKMQEDVRNRHVKRSRQAPVDPGRQACHRNNSGRRIRNKSAMSPQRKIREESTGPMSVRHSPHGRYSSPETDSDDLHLGDAILDLQDTDSEESELASLDEGACERYKDASPAEGLILRKQVMENYATRANDRAWHYVYITQDGPSLMFYKDRMGKELGASTDKLLLLTNAIISVAKDYFKRKHVFRVQLPNGQQYLFAARDDREMMYWVCRLDAAGAPPTRHHGNRYFRLPATITTIPPPMSGSPTRSERLKNFIKGGVSALLK